MPLLRTGWSEASTAGLGQRGAGGTGLRGVASLPHGPPALKDRAQPGEPLWTGPVVTRPAGHRSPYCSPGARPSPDHPPLLCSRPVSWSPHGTPASPQETAAVVRPGHCPATVVGLDQVIAISKRSRGGGIPSVSSGGAGVCPRRQLEWGVGRREQTHNRASHQAISSGMASRRRVARQDPQGEAPECSSPTGGSTQ